MTEPSTDDLREQVAMAIARYDWNNGLSANGTPGEHTMGETDAALEVVAPLLAARDTEIERLHRDAVARKEVDHAAYMRHREHLINALGLDPGVPQGSLIALIVENVTALTGERNQLQEQLRNLCESLDQIRYAAGVGPEVGVDELTEVVRGLNLERDQARETADRQGRQIQSLARRLAARFESETKLREQADKLRLELAGVEGERDSADDTLDLIREAFGFKPDEVEGWVTLALREIQRWRPAAQEAPAPPGARGEGEEGGGRVDSGRARREEITAVQTVGTGYPQGSRPGRGAATPAPSSPRLAAQEAGEPPAPRVWQQDDVAAELERIAEGLHTSCRIDDLIGTAEAAARNGVRNELLERARELREVLEGGGTA